MGVNHDNLAVEQYRPYLVAIARLQLSARPWLAANLDASDLAQNALVKALAARDQFRGRSPGEMGAWLRQILVRTLANELRARGQAKRAGGERSLEADLEASSARLGDWLAADQSSPSQRAEHIERVEALAAAVAQLPPDQREVILCKHCEGLSLAEIASRVGRTLPAVAGLLRRGLEELRQLVDEDHRP